MSTANFEQFLNELGPLPSQIANHLQRIKEIDKKKIGKITSPGLTLTELQNVAHRIARSHLQQIEKLKKQQSSVSRQQINEAKKRVIEKLQSQFAQIQELSG
jgi:predicted RNase H-like nuclease